MTRPDWIVIGAGIAGAACAYFLAADGHRVTLLDRGGLAGGTSSAGQNNIGVPLGAGEATPYFQAALAAYATLLDRGFDLGFRRHGHLYVARDELTADALRRAVGQTRPGVVAQLVAPSELRDVEPRLSREIEVAVLMPDGAQVSPMQTVFELVNAASRLGARIVTGAEVRGITMVKGRLGAVETSSGSFEAGGIVIAAGVWSRAVGAFAGLEVPVFPRRGQVLVTEPAAGLLTHCLTDYAFDEALMAGSGRGSGEAIIGTVIQPLPRGNLLIGGSVEDVGFDRAVDRRIQAQITRRALAWVPDLRSLRIIRTYAGLRPATRDGWPIVGASSRVPGMMLATGHGGGGIDGGPVAGRLIADLVAGRPPVIDPRAVSPDRFGEDLYTADSHGAQAPLQA